MPENIPEVGLDLTPEDSKEFFEKSKKLIEEMNFRDHLTMPQEREKSVLKKR